MRVCLLWSREISQSLRQNVPLHTSSQGRLKRFTRLQAPSDCRWSGISLVLFFFSPKDTSWCFRVLYPLPHILLPSPSPHFPQIPTLSFTPTSPFGTWWVGKSRIWRLQMRGFPGSHSICCYLCSPSGKGRGGALCLSIGLLAYLLQ